MRVGCLIGIFLVVLAGPALAEPDNHDVTRFNSRSTVNDFGSDMWWPVQAVMGETFTISASAFCDEATLCTVASMNSDSLQRNGCGQTAFAETGGTADHKSFKFSMNTPSKTCTFSLEFQVTNAAAALIADWIVSGSVRITPPYNLTAVHFDGSDLELKTCAGCQINSSLANQPGAALRLGGQTNGTIDVAGGIEIYDRTHNLTKNLDILGGIEVYDRQANSTKNVDVVGGIEVYDRQANSTKNVDVVGGIEVYDRQANSTKNVDVVGGIETYDRTANATKALTGVFEIEGGIETYERNLNRTLLMTETSTVRQDTDTVCGSMNVEVHCLDYPRHAVPNDSSFYVRASALGVSGTNPLITFAPTGAASVGCTSAAAVSTGGINPNTVRLFTMNTTSRGCSFTVNFFTSPSTNHYLSGYVPAAIENEFNFGNFSVTNTSVNVTNPSELTLNTGENFDIGFGFSAVGFGIALFGMIYVLSGKIDSIALYLTGIVVGIILVVNLPADMTVWIIAVLLLMLDMVYQAFKKYRMGDAL